MSAVPSTAAEPAAAPASSARAILCFGEALIDFLARPSTVAGTGRAGRT